MTLYVRTRVVANVGLKVECWILFHRILWYTTGKGCRIAAFSPRRLIIRAKIFTKTTHNLLWSYWDTLIHSIEHRGSHMYACCRYSKPKLFTVSDKLPLHAPPSRKHYVLQLLHRSCTVVISHRICRSAPVDQLLLTSVYRGSIIRLNFAISLSILSALSLLPFSLFPANRYGFRPVNGEASSGSGCCDAVGWNALSPGCNHNTEEQRRPQQNEAAYLASAAATTTNKYQWHVRSGN